MIYTQYKPKNMKIVVTGCAGFIGSSLCKHLLNQGKKVVGIDNFLCGLSFHSLNILNILLLITASLDIYGNILI